jgi:hypothetical protein
MLKQEIGMSELGIWMSEVGIGLRRYNNVRVG